MSKGLEALQEIKQDLSGAQNDYLNIFQNCNFRLIEKELKALEIIRNKCSPLLKQYLLDLLPKEESKLVEEVLCEKEQKI